MSVTPMRTWILASVVGCGLSLAPPALAQDAAPKPAVQAEELPAPAPGVKAVVPDVNVPVANEPAANAPAAEGNKWRFKQQDGRWWYWLPSNRWIYWQNGNWVLDAAATDRSPVTDAPASPPVQLAPDDGRAKDPANAWRFKQHDGRWWYYMPDQTWVVYSNTKNAWVKYDPATFAQEFPAPAPSSYAYRGGYRPRSSVNLYLGGGRGYAPYGYGAYPYGGFGYPYGGFGYPYGGGFGGYGGSGIYIGRGIGGYGGYGGYGGGYGGYGRSGVGIGFGFN